MSYNLLLHNPPTALLRVLAHVMSYSTILPIIALEALTAILSVFRISDIPAVGSGWYAPKVAAAMTRPFLLLFGTVLTLPDPSLDQVSVIRKLMLVRVRSALGRATRRFCLQVPVIRLTAQGRQSHARKHVR